MVNQQPISIVSAANRLYAMPLTVMLTSVVCNAKSGRDIDLYILESDFSGELREKVEASLLQNVNGAFRLGIHWIKLDKSQLKDLPVAAHAPHITAEAYARLLAPGLLPATCRRAVYLDCDLVVLGDVADLNDALDDRYTVAAVANVFFPYVSSLFRNTTIPIVFNHVELGIPATNRYFQSGVMVINLDLWRERKITPRIIQYLETYQDKVYFLDQGGLNAVLFDQWMRLDQRWNQTATIFQPERWCPPASSKRDWVRVKNHPLVVHYTGPDKPWRPGYKRPRAAFFYRYLARTAFKDEVKSTSLERVVGYRIYFWLWQIKHALQSLASKRHSQHHE